MKMTLELTDKQMGIIHAALDLYSRVHMGQFTDLPTPNDKFGIGLEKADTIKSILFPELPRNGFYGIHSPIISDDARISWDILQVVRQMYAWKKIGKTPGVDRRDWSGEEHSMMGVSYDDPMKSSETEPLPGIELKDVDVYGK